MKMNLFVHNKKNREGYHLVQAHRSLLVKALYNAPFQVFCQSLLILDCSCREVGV